MTVLDQPASDPHDRAVRWRQLVDLVARAGGEAGNPLVDRALELLRADRELVADPRRRAARARRMAAIAGARRRGEPAVHPDAAPRYAALATGRAAGRRT